MLISKIQSSFQVFFFVAILAIPGLAKAEAGPIVEMLSAGCGDGVCRFFERRSGKCPQDCKKDDKEPLDPPQNSLLHGPMCQIEDIEMLFPSTGGFSISPANRDLVVYTRPDKKKISQVFLRNLKTAQDRCLTCDNKIAGPESSLHKGAPEFHPDGKHIVLQVEMAEHRLKGQLGGPGAGWFNNLWMTDISGERWWQLTDYPHGAKDSYGVLLPHISPDGKRIAWSQLYKSDPHGQKAYIDSKIIPHTNPFGRWRLNIADLIIDNNGPTLVNTQSLRPGDGNFYEPQTWSPDSTELLFAADIGRDHVMKLDLWKIDFKTKELTLLTDTDYAWEEFGSFSPDGKKIAYMSSACCGWNPEDPKSIPFGKTLMTEVYLMNSDGSKKLQISSLNKNGLPGSKYEKYLSGRKIFTKNAWSKDGTKLYSEMVFFSRFGRPKGAGVWQLSFAGPCGSQANSRPGPSSLLRSLSSLQSTKTKSLRAKQQSLK